MDTKILSGSPPNSSPTRRRPRTLYLAAPLDLFHTPAHRKALAAARRQFAGYRIIDPSRLRWNSEKWLEEWPWVLPQLDVLLVLPRGDGTVGMGCWREIADARKAGLPVWALSLEAQSFRPLQHMRRVRWPHRTLVDYARVHISGGDRGRRARSGEWVSAANELSMTWYQPPALQASPREIPNRA